MFSPFKSKLVVVFAIICFLIYFRPTALKAQHIPDNFINFFEVNHSNSITYNSFLNLDQNYTSSNLFHHSAWLGLVSSPFMITQSSLFLLTKNPLLSAATITASVSSLYFMVTYINTSHKIEKFNEIPKYNNSFPTESLLNQKSDTPDPKNNNYSPFYTNADDSSEPLSSEYNPSYDKYWSMYSHEEYASFILDSLFYSDLSKQDLKTLKTFVYKALKLEKSVLQDIIKKSIEHYISVYVPSEHSQIFINDDADPNNPDSLIYIYNNHQLSSWDQKKLRNFLSSQITTALNLKIFLATFLNIGDSNSINTDRVNRETYNLLRLLLTYDISNSKPQYGPIASNKLAIKEITDLIRSMPSAELKARIKENAELFYYAVSDEVLDKMTPSSVADFVDSISIEDLQYYFCSTLLNIIEYKKPNLHSFQVFQSKEISIDDVEKMGLQLFNNFLKSDLNIVLYELQKTFNDLSDSDIKRVLSQNLSINRKIRVNDYAVLKFKKYINDNIIDKPDLLHIFLVKFFNLTTYKTKDLANKFNLELYNIDQKYIYHLKNFIKSYVHDYNSLDQTNKLQKYSYDELKNLFNSMDDAMIFKALSQNLSINRKIRVNDYAVLKFKKYINDNIIDKPDLLHIFLVKFFNLTTYKTKDLANKFNLELYNIDQKYIYHLQNFIKSYVDDYNSLNQTNKLQQHSHDELKNLFNSMDDAMIFKVLSQNLSINRKIQVTDHTVLKFKKYINDNIIDKPELLHIFLVKFFNLTTYKTKDLANKFNLELYNIDQKYIYHLQNFIKSYVDDYNSLNQTNKLQQHSHDELKNLFNSMDDAMIFKALSQNLYINRKIQVTDNTVLKFKKYINDNIIDKPELLHIFLVKFFNLTTYKTKDLANKFNLKLYSIDQKYIYRLRKFIKSYVDDYSSLNQTNKLQQHSHDELKNLFNSMDDAMIFKALSQNLSINRKIQVTDNTVLKFKKYINDNIIDKPELLHIFLVKLFNLTSYKTKDLASTYNSESVLIDRKYHNRLQKFIKSYVDDYSSLVQTNNNLQKYSHNELKDLFHSLDNTMIFKALSENNEIKERIQITDRTVWKFKEFMNDYITIDKYELHLFLVIVFNLTDYTIKDLAKTQNLTQGGIKSAFNVLINQFISYYYKNTSLFTKPPTFDELMVSFDKLPHRKKLYFFKNSLIFDRNNPYHDNFSLKLLDEFIQEKLADDIINQYLFFATTLNLVNSKLSAVAKHLSINNRSAKKRLSIIKHQFFKFYETKFPESNYSNEFPESNYSNNVVAKDDIYFDKFVKYLNLPSLDSLKATFYNLSDSERLELVKRSRLFTQQKPIRSNLTLSDIPNNLSVLEVIDTFIQQRINLKQFSYRYLFFANILNLANSDSRVYSDEYLKNFKDKLSHKKSTKTLKELFKSLGYGPGYIKDVTTKTKYLFFTFFRDYYPQAFNKSVSKLELLSLDQLKNYFFSLSDNERLELFKNSMIFDIKSPPEDISMALIDQFIEKEIYVHKDYDYIFFGKILRLVDAEAKDFALYLSKSRILINRAIELIRKSFFKFYQDY